MSIKWWLPLALVLTACPSPEDGEGEAQAGPGNAAGQGGGPGGGPGGGAAGGPGGGVFDDVTGTQCNASMDEQAGEAQYTQEQLSSGEVASVTFSGTITCSSCSSPLTLRVGLQPTDGAPVEGGPSILTSAEVQPNAPYEIKVPQGESKVVLELLGGDNGSWFGVKDDQGNIVTSADLSGLDLDVSKCGDASSGGTNTPPPDNNQQPGPANVQADGTVTAEPPAEQTGGNGEPTAPADLPPPPNAETPEGPAQ